MVRVKPNFITLGGSNPHTLSAARWKGFESPLQKRGGRVLVPTPKDMIIHFKNLIKILFASSAVLLLVNCSQQKNNLYNPEILESIEQTTTFETTESKKEEVVPFGAKALIESYPDFNLRYSDNAIVFEDGTRIIYDDGIESDYLTKLDNCDIKDMFSQEYDASVIEPPYIYDPGRYRCEEFFNKMYGSSNEEITKNLTSVYIFGNEFIITKVNGISEKFKKLAKIIETHEDWRPYFAENAGGFNYRSVSSTGRMSAHSYGIAIDINSQLTNYWKWGNSKLSEIDEIKNINKDKKIPYEIVELFEQNGFIWGGRWYHYDTMHFEYRPELFVINKD